MNSQIGKDTDYCNFETEAAVLINSDTNFFKYMIQGFRLC